MKQFTTKSGCNIALTETPEGDTLMSMHVEHGGKGLATATVANAPDGSKVILGTHASVKLDPEARAALRAALGETWPEESELTTPEGRLGILVRETFPWSVEASTMACQTIRGLLSDVATITANRDEWASRMMEFATAEQRLQEIMAILEKAQEDGLDVALVPKQENPLAAIYRVFYDGPMELTVTSSEKPMDLLSAPTEEDAQVMAGVEVASRWFSERPWWLANMVRAVLAEVTDEYDHILTRQGQLLRDTVNALRGDPPELTWWSLHDVPDLAKAAVEVLAQHIMGGRAVTWEDLTPENREHYRAEAREQIIEGAKE